MFERIKNWLNRLNSEKKETKIERDESEDDCLSSIGVTFESNYNENNEPLGLPRGSVRAMLVIIFTSTVCLGFAKGRIKEEFFFAIAGLVILSYFYSRIKINKKM